MNRNKPCYEFDRDFALQILNKESTFASVKQDNVLRETIKEDKVNSDFDFSLDDLNL